jgi:hypothetical protein
MSVLRDGISIVSCLEQAGLPHSDTRPRLLERSKTPQGASEAAFVDV